MSLLTANDIPVARAEISLPRIGRGVADLLLADKSGPATGDAITLKWETGESMRYTCTTAGEFSGAWRLRAVAGNDCLDKILPHRYYQNIPAATVARDILSEAGEQAGQIDLSKTFIRYVRRAGPAYRQLIALLADSDRIWRINTDGSVWIGQDDSSETISVVLSDADFSASRYRLELTPGLALGRRLEARINSNTLNLGIIERITHHIGPNLYTEVYCAN